jgi:hypothetical protein
MGVPRSEFLKFPDAEGKGNVYVRAYQIAAFFPWVGDDYKGEKKTLAHILIRGSKYTFVAGCSTDEVAQKIQEFEADLLPLQAILPNPPSDEEQEAKRVKEMRELGKALVQGFRDGEKDEWQKGK